MDEKSFNLYLNDCIETKKIRLKSKVKNFIDTEIKSHIRSWVENDNSDFRLKIDLKNFITNSETIPDIVMEEFYRYFNRYYCDIHYDDEEETYFLYLNLSYISPNLVIPEPDIFGYT